MTNADARDDSRGLRPQVCLSPLAVPFPVPSVSRFPLPVSRNRYLTPVKKTVQKLMAEYGTVAVIVYFTIFFATLGGFWLAIRFGWRPSSAAGSVGTLAAAYIATKLTQPIRIAATVVVTPFVAKLYERARGRSARVPNGAPDPVTRTEAPSSD